MVVPELVAVVIAIAIAVAYHNDACNIFKGGERNSLSPFEYEFLDRNGRRT